MKSSSLKYKYNNNNHKMCAWQKRRHNNDDVLEWKCD